MHFGSIKLRLKRKDTVHAPRQQVLLIVYAIRSVLFSIHEVQTDDIFTFKNGHTHTRKAKF